MGCILAVILFPLHAVAFIFEYLFTLLAVIFDSLALGLTKYCKADENQRFVKWLNDRSEECYQASMVMYWHQ